MYEAIWKWDEGGGKMEEEGGRRSGKTTTTIDKGSTAANGRGMGEGQDKDHIEDWTHVEHRSNWKQQHRTLTTRTQNEHSQFTLNRSTSQTHSQHVNI